MMIDTSGVAGMSNSTCPRCRRPQFSPRVGHLNSASHQIAVVGAGHVKQLKPVVTALFMDHFGDEERVRAHHLCVPYHDVAESQSGAENRQPVHWGWFGVER